MATRTPFEVINHTRKVCSLYKRACRNLLSIYYDRAIWRYNCVLLRQEFEEHRNETDPIKISKILEAAEKRYRAELHYRPFVFPDSPGGVAFEREVNIPDSAVDFWDPVEKAFYPTYFAIREQRKKEYVEMWQKKYGKVNPKDYENPYHH